MNYVQNVESYSEIIVWSVEFHWNMKWVGAGQNSLINNAIDFITLVCGESKKRLKIQLASFIIISTAG